MVEDAGALERFRQSRAEALAAENGWLSVAGLFWLEAGENSVGSAEGSTVRLPPYAPARLGTLTLDGQSIRLSTEEPIHVDDEPTQAANLRTDAGGKPSRVTIGDTSFAVLKRGDRYAARLRDNRSPQRLGFTGLEWFPPSPRHRITARFVESPKTLEITNVLGMVSPAASPGYVEFELGGQTFRLTAQSRDPGEYLFFNFKDRTNGLETYPAGRFLNAGGVRDGQVVLDFNYATNPYCAYTAFATCPLPPAENSLPVRVEAGEKNYPHD